MTILQKQTNGFFIFFESFVCESFVKPKFKLWFWPITICVDSQMNQSDLKEIHDSTKRGKVRRTDYAGKIFLSAISEVSGIMPA